MESQYERWQPSISEYFRDFRDGHYSELEQLWIIIPEQKLIISDDHGAIFFGNLGVDGLQIAFRAGCTGVWVFYPYDCEWVQKSDSIRKFLDGWRSGSITV
jgi:hypothetical protein